MTALGIEISTRDVDRFYWPDPPSHGKPLDLLEVESRIDKLEARYIRMTDIEPLDWDALEELDDEIKQLTKVRDRIWNEWQQSKKEVMA